MFLGAKTNEIVRTFDELFRRGQGEDGHNFTPETCPRRVLLMGTMGEIPNSSKGPKEVKRYFCQTRKEMQLSSESSTPGTSCTLVQVQKRLGL